MGNETFDVFVSYARADARHAVDIVSVLRARGLTLFFDRYNLPPGLPWVRGLEKALNAAKAAIILIGPHGLGNTQQYERDLAIVRQTRDPSFPIVPVILPEAEIDRPFNFLQILTWVDFSHVAKVTDAPAELEHLMAAISGEQDAAAKLVREAICPYRGLDAFREEDSVFFFGRGDADDPKSTIGQLVGKVREHPFVMVVGRSGSGKSSLVYAGLVPALRRARDRFWNVLSLRPGSDPIEALAVTFNPQADGEGSATYAAKIGAEADQLRTGAPEMLSRMIRQELDRSEGNPDRLLLYIDQWEELYAQAPSPAEKDRAARHTADVNRFIDLLLNASRSAPVSVVATVRADFYDPLISHHKIQVLLPTQQVVLGAMSRTDLESTIIEPAKMVGLSFAPPKLVSRILDEAGEDEGMLPLLQYALKETWALREGSVMTADSYTRSGGVREAIRLTAERAFDDLSADDQQAARKLFLRLVTPGEGQEDTRARAAMPEEPALRKIVDQFAGPRTRLLVTDRTLRAETAVQATVEVAHEALIRTWPRLRQWVDANRDKLRARAAILQAKAEWEKHGRRNDLLLPAGFQLERARLLTADPGDIAIDDVREFIDESIAADDAKVAQEHERQAAQVEAANALAAASRRVAQRTLAGLATALVLALIAVGIGIYAYLQANEAERQRSDAMTEKAEATARRIDQSISELERQISWVTRASVVTVDQHRADYIQLLNQVSDIAQLSQLTGDGREILRMTRKALAIDSGLDYSHDPRFTETVARGVSFSPIYFEGTQPFMSIAVAHSRFNAGVTVAEVDLRFLSNFLDAQVGRATFAYVVDSRGQVIASSSKGPEVASDLAKLPQVAAQTAPVSRALAQGTGADGNSVLSASSTVPKLGWIVFFEQPTAHPDRLL
jgi:hypothetical protein